MDKLEQYLSKKIDEHNKEFENNQKKKNNKIKGIYIAAVALLLAGLTAIGGCVGLKKKKDSNKNVPTEPTSTVATYDETEPTTTMEETISLDELGTKYEQPVIEEETPEYGEVTGDVDKEEIVEKDDNLWKDQEAADKSEEVGREEIDDKDGTLEVTPNGDVYEKEDGYEIKKEDGTVITGTQGENDSELPDGYVHDDNLDKDVAEEDANKFVYVDADYYDMNGELVFAKGDIVLKETLERIKNDPNFTTTKPKIEETVPETQPTEPAEDKGVYVDEVGNTWASYQDYESALTDTYGIYADENGVLHYSAELSKNQKPTENTVQEPEETLPTEPEEITSETQPTKNEETDSLGGVVNKDGTYTIYGMTYMDKATFENFILDENSEQNFGIYNGIIYPKEVIDEMYKEKQNTK